MVNQVTNNLVEDYNPSRINNLNSNPNPTNNELINGYNQVSLINGLYDTTTPQQQQQNVDSSTNASTSSYTNSSYSNASFNNTSLNNASYYPSYFYYPNQNEQFNNQLVRRNSFNNYDQSTDSEQYLINSYYELSDHLEHQPSFQQQQQHFQQDPLYNENYHHLNGNHNGNQIVNNHHQYIYENYYTDYLANQNGNGINLNLNFFKRIRERIKNSCNKNSPCMALVLILVPIFFATILVLVFFRLINKTDKTDKDDLHQYAIYAFIIFSIAFIAPFVLFFLIVVVNKMIKKYKKCFNPNFISNDEFVGDLMNAAVAANIIDPNHLLSNCINNGSSNSTNLNLNATTNTANNHHLITQTSHHSHPSNLIDQQSSSTIHSSMNSNLIDLQNSLQSLQTNLLNSSLQAGLHQTTLHHQDNQQISTLNVNQLSQFSNNRQLINEMIEEFDQMNEIDQERTLQRMSSIQRRQRLQRQNAFESSPERHQSTTELSNLIYYENDKPPSYEFALLCPKREEKDDEQKTKVKDKKLVSSSSIAKQTNNSINNLNSETSILQAELRNNSNRRRSSNGSSVNTEPPTYSSLYQFENLSNQQKDSKFN